MQRTKAYNLQNEIAFTSDMSSPVNVDRGVLEFNEVRKLRHAYDRIVSAHALCRSNVIVLAGIEKISESVILSNNNGEAVELLGKYFTSAAERLRGYLQGFEVLERKALNAINLVGPPVET